MSSSPPKVHTLQDALQDGTYNWLHFSRTRCGHLVTPTDQILPLARIAMDDERLCDSCRLSLTRGRVPEQRSFDYAHFKGTLEYEYLCRLLEATDHHAGKAIAISGLSRAKFYRMLKAHGLQKQYVKRMTIP